MTDEKYIEINYPENPLTTRLKLSYDWMGDNNLRLLDAGCSYGYGTRFFSNKANETYGIDVDEDSLKVAQSRYPHINFSYSMLEDTKFDDEFFDVIIMNDVLEHTEDKIRTLSEMYRILKPGGKIIISTPHKGIFAFIDPYNYGHNVRKYLPFLYKSLFKAVRKIKGIKSDEEGNPAHLDKHFHYSESDYYNMLNRSSFRGKYKVERIYKSGLFFEVLALNIDFFLNIFFSRKVTDIINTPFNLLGRMDYWISYGRFSYNIAMKLRKNPD